MYAAGRGTPPELWGLDRHELKKNRVPNFEHDAAEPEMKTLTPQQLIPKSPTGLALDSPCQAWERGRLADGAIAAARVAV